MNTGGHMKKWIVVAIAPLLAVGCSKHYQEQSDISIINRLQVIERNDNQRAGHLVVEVLNVTGQQMQDVSLQLVSPHFLKLDHDFVPLGDIDNADLAHFGEGFSAAQEIIKPGMELSWQISYRDQQGKYYEQHIISNVMY